MLEPTNEMQDNYTWAMKISFLKSNDPNDDWKKKNGSQKQILGVVKELGEKYTYFSEGAMKIMASLVPDEVIYNISDYSKKEVDACLLIGDVSGFTELCEKYNKAGRGGPSKLTQVLNAYIGAMVQQILSHGGDVLKFSGDAFIAVWKETEQMSLRDAVHEAIDCSLVIQKSYGTYQTDIDVVVRVKLGVSCGRLMFSLIGTEENTHYLLIGQPVYDVKEAEHLSQAGDIITSAKVGRHISANEYLIEPLPDGIHAKVLGVGPNWRTFQRHYDQKQEVHDIISADIDEGNEDELESSSSSTSNTSKYSTTLSLNQDQYALRPAVNYACRYLMKDDLKRFILAPVLRGIEAEEPLEFLTEIRQVVILFMNCKVDGNLPTETGLDVSNKVYIAVCSIVSEHNGCVNKINYFDKDLMVLVIFGLRGFKHELESRIALTCAKLCYEGLKKIEHINSVSIGVTTGKTYCGAFGHALRREYTVIGLIVNKAARMMTGYVNKVTCDRETFLHSKLESSHFLLQEFKPLKGIISPGPIYEYKEVEKIQESIFRYNPQPLLGRDQEVDLYKILFEQASQYSAPHVQNVKVCNMLIVQGAQRQGKTRLLEELMFITDNSIPMLSFGVTFADYEVPYHTIGKIFNRFFGKDKPTEQNKMNVLRHSFENSTYKQYLCLLNAVFNVNFEKSSDYSKLSNQQKYEGLKKIFVTFAKMVFKTMWFIVIDDSEYVDDESWLLIEHLLDHNLVFITTTMGSHKFLSTLAIQVLKNERIKVIVLKGIDQWYHVGLACQMLGADGIPPELEKIIQKKSYGNPGWVESFLVTLQQSGGLNIIEMTRRDAYDSGIVVAPLYMLLRLSNEERMLYYKLTGEEVFSESLYLETRWKIFIESCRESFPDLSVTEHTDRLSKCENLMIALLNPLFNLEDVDPELLTDVIILKTFDALTSYEQLLLKCSSILGDVFLREMLLYIMNSTGKRITALAVKKLFEINVLCCARGNFIEGGLNFKDRLLNPNEELSIKCECRGLIINENCADLPKYASCGYLRYRSSTFREITYNLLTENQKREFHEKAIRYLEKESRRCRACGLGYFTRQMGMGRLDRNLNTNTSKKRRGRRISVLNQVMDISNDTYDQESLRSAESVMSLRAKETFRRDTTLSFGSEALSDTMSGRNSTDTGFRMSETVVRTFSQFDFTQCTCLLILSTFYSQIIEHCKGADLGEKILSATVEYAYVCIECNNIPQAIRILEEALALLDGPMKDQIEWEWMISLKRGKFFTLLGKARLPDDEAYSHLIEALKCYGVKFPKTKLGRRIWKLHVKLRHFFRFNIWKNKFYGRVSDDVAEYYNNVSECLNLLCSFFFSRQQFLEAELAAVWSLNLAMKSETDFEKMCRAYGNVLLVSARRGHDKFCLRMEKFALKLCYRKGTFVEYDELKAVAFLYFSIACSSLRVAEIINFLQVGNMAWRLAASSRSSWIVMNLIPKLAHVHLTKKQVLEFGHMVQEVVYILAERTNLATKTWYYAMTIQIHIETGLSIEPFSKCVNFLLAEGKDSKDFELDGSNRMVVLIWLWEVRVGNWESALRWQAEAWKFDVLSKGDTLQNLITALYLVEGLIIFLVDKMDMKNLNAVDRANNLIQHIFKGLIKHLKRCRFIKARFFHLRSYYQIAKSNDYKGGFKWLSLAKKSAEKCQNDLELKWIDHSEKAWLRKLPREEVDFWKDHAEEDNLIDYRDIEYLEKFVQYTLPLPLYL